MAPKRYSAVATLSGRLTALLVFQGLCIISAKINHRQGKQGQAAATLAVTPEGSAKSGPAARISSLAETVMKKGLLAAVIPQSQSESPHVSIPFSVMATEFSPSKFVEEPSTVAAASLLETHNDRMKRDRFSFLEESDSVKRRSGSGGVGHVHAETVSMETPYIGPSPMHQVTVHPMATVWLHALSLGAIVKGICMGSNVLFQVSPYPKARDIYLSKDTGETDAAPFVFITLSGTMYLYYGLFAYSVTARPGYLTVVCANLLGAILGINYVFVYHTNCWRKEAAKKLEFYYKIVGTVVVLQVVAFLFLPQIEALYLAGMTACICSTASCASPLATISVVIATKNAASIPLEMTVISFLSCIAWITCGFMIHDPWIMVPATLGAIANVISLSFIIRYGRGSTSEKDVLIGSKQQGPCYAAATTDGELGNPPSSSRESSQRMIRASSSRGPQPAEPETPPLPALKAAASEPALANLCNMGSTGTTGETA